MSAWFLLHCLLCIFSDRYHILAQKEFSLKIWLKWLHLFVKKGTVSGPGLYIWNTAHTISLSAFFLKTNTHIQTLVNAALGEKKGKEKHSKKGNLYRPNDKINSLNSWYYTILFIKKHFICCNNYSKNFIHNYFKTLLDFFGVHLRATNVVKFWPQL